MKLTYLIIFLTLINFSYSQVVPSENTFIVYLEDDDPRYKKVITQKGNKMETIFYNINFPQTNPYSLKNEIIQIIHRNYADFDQMQMNNPVPIFKLNKSFRKKNKDIIFDIDKLHKIGFENCFKLFKEAKHIFLIDGSDNENGKIILKKVFLFYVSEE